MYPSTPRALARTSGRTVATLLLVLGVTACGSDPAISSSKTLGSVTQADAGKLASTTAPTLTVTGMPTQGPAVQLEGEWHADAGLMTVRIYLADFPALFGAAAHLRYDPEGLEMTKLTMADAPRGPSADSATWTARSVGKESPAGRILLGGARVAMHPSPFLPLEGAKVGKELWATAQFRVKKPGTFALTFDPAHQVARGADGKDQVATWTSATITVPDMPLEVKP